MKLPSSFPSIVVLIVSSLVPSLVSSLVPSLVPSSGNATYNNQKKILVTTYNVASTPASESDLKNLLNLPQDPKDLPDIVAMGFQEVAFSPTSAFRTSDYEKKAFEVLSRRNYRLLDSVRLVSLLLVVYVRSDNGLIANGNGRTIPEIGRVEKSWIRTGFGGLFGNKGGVGISMLVNEKRVGMINSHMTPHEGRLSDRVKDYNSILNGLVFDRHGNILDHDYVIWFGDLNFRLQLFSGQEILNAIQENDLRRVFERDELTMVRNEGRAFHGFKEAQVTFNPTYKFYPNGNSYNLKRKPAWTDRIQYRMKPNEPGLDASQHSYTGHFDICTSDHRPVTSIILINA